MLSIVAFTSQPGLAATGQQTASLRDVIQAANLRLVGTIDPAMTEPILSADDIGFLVAAREPISLNAIIAGGLPVRASRIRQLIDWGLLEQTGMQFVSRFPILAGDRADSFDALIDEAVNRMVGEVAVELLRVSDHVWRHPGVPTLPVLTAWLLHELAWELIAGRDGIDLRSHTVQQRATHPERAFWGVLWYVADPVPPAYVFSRTRHEDYALLVCWKWGESADPFEGTDLENRRARFLDELRDDGRRINRPEFFPDAIQAGLITDDKDVRALARKYEVRSDEHLAKLVDDAAFGIARAILTYLPHRQIAQVLSTDQQSAVTIGYRELVPRLAQALFDRKLLVFPGDRRAVWQTDEDIEVDPTEGDTESGAEDEAPPDRPILPLRATLEGSLETGGGAIGIIDVPRFSAIIWKDLPPRTIIELPW